MSNTFNIGRFWKYFKWDLRNAKNNFGLSLLIAASLPVIIFFIAEFCALVFGGHFIETGLANQFGALFVGLTIVMLVMPVKVYGGLTDKRQGSDWLMIPASSLEKSLSMILMGCIVAPVCFLAVFHAWDFLLSWLFPNHYGEALLTRMPLLDLANFADLEDAEGFDPSFFNFNMPLAIIMSWFQNILIFTLGAICFKKSKSAKTILVYFAFSMLCSTIVTTILGVSAGNFAISTWNMDNMDISETVSTAMHVGWVISSVFLAGLIFAVYSRVRTLRH